MRGWLCVAVLAAACGGGAGTGDDTQPDAPGDSSGDGSVTPTWTKLIGRSWQLLASTEGYKCVRIKIQQDTWISGIRSLQPVGTHHETLTISPSPGTLGEYDCSAAEDLQMELLYGGGANTDAFMFPAGVAIKLPAGSFINLNLHVANFGDSLLSGTSAIEVLTVPGSSVVHEADMMFVGTFHLDIPPTNAPYVDSGSCMFPADWHVFNLWPHMHKYAVHQRVKVLRNDGSTDVLLDTDYAVTEQRNYPQPDVLVGTNETLWVDCTYVNDTNITYPPGYTIQYGEGALGEMCFAGFYKYPAGGTTYFCAAN